MPRLSRHAWRRLQRGEWRLFSPPPQSLPKIQIHVLVIETSRARIIPLSAPGNDTRHRTDTSGCASKPPLPHAAARSAALGKVSQYTECSKDLVMNGLSASNEPCAEPSERPTDADRS